MKLVVVLLSISAASGVFASPVTKTGAESILDKRACAYDSCSACEDFCWNGL
ncbi:hypothetical protein CGMCC3_g16948 [Colletotrichum fructicola]|nr:uncharacterized protein CGMCC3_g16948 [Colletotrichum fructicola]KAE9566893.1 hypothetical protein CGMCC3_g16948 [Colletotrichum fructicola]